MVEKLVAKIEHDAFADQVPHVRLEHAEQAVEERCGHADGHDQDDQAVVGPGLERGVDQRLRDEGRDQADRRAGDDADKHDQRVPPVGQEITEHPAQQGPGQAHVGVAVGLVDEGAAEVPHDYLITLPSAWPGYSALGQPFPGRW